MVVSGSGWGACVTGAAVIATIRAWCRARTYCATETEALAPMDAKETFACHVKHPIVATRIKHLTMARGYRNFIAPNVTAHLACLAQHHCLPLLQRRAVPGRPPGDGIGERFGGFLFEVLPGNHIGESMNFVVPDPSVPRGRVGIGSGVSSSRCFRATTTPATHSGKT